MPIYLIAVIKVKPQYRTVVNSALLDMVAKTLEETACLQYDLHREINDPNTFVFYEIWQNQKGLDLHNNQAYIKEFVVFSEEKLQEKPQLFITNKLDTN